MERIDRVRVQIGGLSRGGGVACDNSSNDYKTQAPEVLFAAPYATGTSIRLMPSPIVAAKTSRSSAGVVGR